MFRQATDMRKCFHGLAAIVTQQMGHDVLSGDIYVFINKRRNAAKLLGLKVMDLPSSTNDWRKEPFKYTR